MTDKRRYGVIETHRLNAETYHLTINGVMWSEVEWSAPRLAQVGELEPIARKVL